MPEEHSVAPSGASTGEPARERSPRMFLPEDLPDDLADQMPGPWPLPPVRNTARPSPPPVIATTTVPLVQLRTRERPNALGLIAGAGLGLIAAAVVGLVMIVDPTTGSAVSPLIGLAVAFGVLGVLGRLPTRVAIVAAVLAACLYAVAVLWATALVTAGTGGHDLGEGLRDVAVAAPETLLEWFSRPYTFAYLAIAVLPVPIASALLARLRA